MATACLLFAALVLYHMRLVFHMRLDPQVDRLMELYQKYSKRLADCEQRMDQVGHSCWVHSWAWFILGLVAWLIRSLCHHPLPSVFVVFVHLLTSSNR
jgi:hypothetical protein